MHIYAHIHMYIFITRTLGNWAKCFPSYWTHLLFQIRKSLRSNHTENRVEESHVLKLQDSRCNEQETSMKTNIVIFFLLGKGPQTTS